MELLKIEEVIEANFYDFNLMWELIEESDKHIKLRFCPRLNNGGDRQVGVEFTISTQNWEWDSFYKEILSNEYFISAYWIKFRLGFSLESYWFKIIDFFKHEFTDCPYKTSPADFCRLTVPFEYHNLLLEYGVEQKETYNPKVGYNRYENQIKGIVFPFSNNR